MLSNPTCWSAFGTSGIHQKGLFRGGGFDGRYLYLTSSGDSTSNLMTRYDTAHDFGAASSWSTFNLSAVNASTPAFFGALFDGRFMYFMPCDPGFGSTLSRYDTQMDSRRRRPGPISTCLFRLGTPNVELGLPACVQFLNTSLIRTRGGITISATWAHNLRRVWRDQKNRQIIPPTYAHGLRRGS